MKNLLNNISTEEREKILEQHYDLKKSLNEQMDDNDYAHDEDAYDEMVNFAGGFKVIFDLLADGRLNLSEKTVTDMGVFMKSFQEEMKKMNPNDKNNDKLYYFYKGSDFWK
jgi:dsDNA-binding SOS-regulon protein